ncbi:MAG TPA: protein kinase [Gemmataceae bacterium]|nr:protein kinase [Gemmataceae bacterium]
MPINHLSHPDSNQLAAFSLGRLNEGESAIVERHLGACETCRGVLETTNLEDSVTFLFRSVGSNPGNGVQSSGKCEPIPPRLQLGFEILEEIGHGGMGVVYKARQKGLNRLVALKQMRAGLHAEPKELARFRREAETAARLHHPNIVAVHDVGDQDGQPYLVMEFVEGISLAQRLGQSTLSPEKAAELVETLARAMDYAHGQGVVHRDLKPSNILLSPISRLQNADLEGIQSTLGNSPKTTQPLALSTQHFLPKISDFGLAKRLDVQESHTQTGAILGTPGYMAPEQALGKAGEIGPAVDIYALGAILYESLTGRPPFRAATLLETLELVRVQEPVALRQLQPGVPRDLETICLKCLEKSPRRRYESAKELADDLRRFLNREPIRARPVSRAEKALKWARRKPAWAALWLVVLAGVASLLAGVAFHNARLREEIERTEASAQEARRQHETALLNYRKAHETLKKILTRLEEDRLFEQPQLMEHRRYVIDTALTYYLEAARDLGDLDPDLRLEAAIAIRQAGFLHQSLGQVEKADAELQRAQSALQALATDFPNRQDMRWELAHCDFLLGGLCAEKIPPEWGQAEAWLTKSLILSQELAQEDSSQPKWQEGLAQAYHALACLNNNANHDEKAEEFFIKEKGVREALEKSPDDTVFNRFCLAEIDVFLGIVYRKEGKSALTVVALQEAEKQLKALLNSSWGMHASTSLAWTYQCWGDWAISQKDIPTALEKYSKGLEILEQVVRSQPRFKRAINLQIEINDAQNRLLAGQRGVNGPTADQISK